MAKKKELRIEFFKREVKAINGLTGKNEAHYYCPICTFPFQKDALDINELTLEHIPPDAQGGRGIALTCSICNHTAGHTIDVAVSDRNKVLSIEPLFTKKVVYNGREDFGDIPQIIRFSDRLVGTYVLRGVPRFLRSLKLQIKRLSWSGVRNCGTVFSIFGYGIPMEHDATSLL